MERTGNLIITHAGYEVSSIVIQLHRANVSALIEGLHCGVPTRQRNDMTKTIYQLEIDALSAAFEAIYLSSIS